MEIALKILTEFGLPVLMVLGMAWFIYKLWQQSKEREDKLMETNNKAIETITICTDRLTAIETDVKEIKQDISVIKEHQHEQGTNHS